VYNDHTEADGSAAFAEACRMGLEGSRVEANRQAVSVWQIGDWIKVHNPNSPAAERFRDREAEA
jgi:hypothetical protein